MKRGNVNIILFIKLNSVITMSVLLSIDTVVMTDMKISQQNKLEKEAEIHSNCS